MTRFRDFDAAVAERESEPIEFRLGGQSFRCIPSAPAGLFTDILRHDRVSMPDLDAFLRGVIEDDDAARFFDVLHDRDNIVTLDQLTELVQWLISEYGGGRPTEPSDSSGNGRPNTMQNLTDDNSAEVEPIFSASHFEPSSTPATPASSSG